MRVVPEQAKSSARRALAILCLGLLCAALFLYVWLSRGHEAAQASGPHGETVAMPTKMPDMTAGNDRQGQVPTPPAQHGSHAAPGHFAESSATIVYRALPHEAHETYTLVFRGGPFPYQKDGAVFGNYEQRLPQRARGYYREYTVKTPRISHRGARRIVCGGSEPTRPRTCYYTADHYASFRQIVDAPASR